MTVFDLSDACTGNREASEESQGGTEDDGSSESKKEEEDWGSGLNPYLPN